MKASATSEETSCLAKMSSGTPTVPHSGRVNILSKLSHGVQTDTPSGPIARAVAQEVFAASAR